MRHRHLIEAIAIRKLAIVKEPAKWISIAAEDLNLTPWILEQVKASALWFVSHSKYFNREDAELPTDLSGESRPRKQRAKRSISKGRYSKIDDKEAQSAARAYEREKKKRDSERRKEEAERNKERNRREQAIKKAQVAIDEAKRDHEKKARKIETERATEKTVSGRGNALGKAKRKIG